MLSAASFGFSDLHRPPGRFVPGREGLAARQWHAVQWPDSDHVVPGHDPQVRPGPGSISFKPAADFWGSATLGFQVQDNAGTTVITGSGSTNAVAPLLAGR